MNKLLIFGLENKLLTLIVFIIISVYAYAGLNKVHLDLSNDSKFTKKEIIQQKIDYGTVKNKKFTDVLYIEFKNKIDSAAIKKLFALNQKMTAVNGVHDIDSIFTHSNFYHDGEMLNIGPVIPDAFADDKEINFQINKALANEILSEKIISRDAKSTVFYLKLSNSGYKNLKQIIKNNAKDFQEIFIIGKKNFDVELREAVINEMIKFTPIMMLVFIIVIYIFHQYWLASILPIFISAVTIFWTFGIMSHLNIPINEMSIILPMLFIVLSSTEDIHLYSYYKKTYESINAPDAKLIASDIMLKKVGKSILLMLFTTIVSFAISIFTPYKIAQDFGYAACIGLTINGFLTLYLTPVVLALIGNPPKPRFTLLTNMYTGLASNLTAFIKRILRINILFIMIPLSVLTILSIYTISQSEFTYNKQKQLNPDSELATKIDKYANVFTNLKHIKLKIEPKSQGNFSNYPNLSLAYDVTKYIKEQPDWIRVNSIADFIAYVNQEFNDGNPKFNNIPRNDLAIEQLYFIAGKDNLNLFLSPNKNQAHVYIYYKNIDAQQLNHNVNNLLKQLNSRFGNQLHFAVSSEDLKEYQISSRINSEQITLIVFITFIIFMVFTFLFASLKIGFISLLPNIVPVIICLALLPLLNVQYSIVTTIVAVIGIGIAVDDTLHFLIKYQDNCHNARDNIDAINTTVANEMLPIISTSSALIFSCLMMWFSDFYVVSQFGLLLAVIIFLTTIFDLTITPLLISKFRFINIWDIFNIPVSDIVKNSPLFYGLYYYELRTVLLITTKEKYTRGEVIKKKNDKNLYFILDGLIKIEKTNSCEDTSFKMPGTLLGLTNLFSENSSNEKLSAYTDSTVLVLNESAMTALTHNYPKIAYKLAKNILALTTPHIEQTTNCEDKIFT